MSVMSTSAETVQVRNIHSDRHQWDSDQLILAFKKLIFDFLITQDSAVT